jgi:hypothetical protein
VIRAAVAGVVAVAVADDASGSFPALLGVAPLGAREARTIEAALSLHAVHDQTLGFYTALTLLKI